MVIHTSTSTSVGGTQLIDSTCSVLSEVPDRSYNAQRPRKAGSNSSSSPGEAVAAECLRLAVGTAHGHRYQEAFDMLDGDGTSESQ